MNDTDDSQALVERVLAASNTAQALAIQGGGSKAFLGMSTGDSSADVLSTLTHAGVVSYEPTELVVTARSGTRLDDLIRVLDDAGQMLPFEPPRHPGATIGGVIACGLSGPRRPYAGSARDYVLGTRVINGQGENLRFGGEVMKNVAGYDVSRLQTGAYGTLGVLLDISMKVLPKPEAELTLVHEAKIDQTESMVALMRQPLPVSAMMQLDALRYTRLSGSESAVTAASRELGGDVLADADKLWAGVRDQSHAFFAAPGDLWRLSVPDFASALPLSGSCLINWGGAERWYVTEASAEEVYRVADAATGHAIRYRSSTDTSDGLQPVTGPMQALQSRLRDSFDAKRIFNRGRFHPELDNDV